MIRAGLIGTGIGEKHLQAIDGYRNCKVVSILETNKKNLPPPTSLTSPLVHKCQVLFIVKVAILQFTVAPLFVFVFHLLSSFLFLVVVAAITLKKVVMRKGSGEPLKEPCKRSTTGERATGRERLEARPVDRSSQTRL